MTAAPLMRSALGLTLAGKTKTEGKRPMRWTLMAAAAVCVASPAFAADKGAYQTPKTSWGAPDLSGNWTNATLTPQTRPALYGTRKVQTPEEVRLLEGDNDAKTEKGNARVDHSAAEAASDNVGAYDRAWIDNGIRVMRVNGEPRTSLITTPDGAPPPRKGSPPRTLPANAGSVEAGLQAVKNAVAQDQFAGQGSAAAGRAGGYDNPEQRGVGERCLIGFGRNAGPPMFPNGWYNNNYAFVQTPNEIAITIEMVHDVRHIRLNAKEHIAPNLRPWFGDSIGHWEGETLVVETTNIPRVQAYNGSWEHLKVTERFTRKGPDRLHYQFTVEDPTVWEKPWGGEYEMKPLKGEVLEYACHEGNYALEGILAGARQAEKEARTVAQGR
jgi:hypothetical protein